MSDDSWIPNKYPMAARGKENFLHPNRKVNHLLAPSNLLGIYGSKRYFTYKRTWHYSPSFNSNNLISHFKKSDKYTVKSGYWLFQALVTYLGDTYVGEPSLTALKTRVWKLKCPWKIKHFIWQVITGFLLVSSRLNQRGINCLSLSTLWSWR